MTRVYTSYTGHETYASGGRVRFTEWSLEPDAPEERMVMLSEARWRPPTILPRGHKTLNAALRALASAAASATEKK